MVAKVDSWKTYLADNVAFVNNLVANQTTVWEKKIKNHWEILESRIKVKEIKFYKVHDEYGFMSNFAPYPFSDGSRIWPTSEHYF